MEKLVYLVWGGGTPRSGDRLRDRLLGDTAGRVLAAGARGLTVNVHDGAAAEAPSPVPTPDGEDPHVAELSVWVDSYDRRDPVDEVVGGIGLPSAGYLVVESLYEDYGTTAHAAPRSWADGERSPGVLTVSLIHRPADLGYATWIERWHGTQSPLSGRLQPRCRYVRNEVVRPLSGDAPEIHGIVEEAWPSAAHVADPMLFFNAGGDPARLSEHVTAMLDSVQACLDLARLRNVTMSEYIVKTLA
ncbi:MAG TPA: hypothetical protein VLZ77_02115 [Acidimicrobiales bacterium]|nr:hypothetical protein [Acidimicrobiales bacterium]